MNGEEPQFNEVIPLPPKSASPTAKPRLNVYTMMLLISLVAIINASALLWEVQTSYVGFEGYKIPPDVRGGPSYQSAPLSSRPAILATRPASSSLG